MGCVRQADDLLVYFGAKPKQRPELEISDETGNGGGKEDPREARGQLTKGDAERQSTTDSRRDQSAGVSSPESTTVSRRRQWGKTVKMSWHSNWSLLKFREKYTPAIVYRCTGNARSHKTPLLALGTDINRYCSFVLFFSFHSLGCITFVAVKKCEYPSGPTRWITGQE